MDLSHPKRIISTNRKRKAKNSMMVTCKRTKFMAKYYQQNFSLPDSVIFYVAKNPKTAELYLKMVKTCKYFFVKNPIIIIPHLDVDGGEYRCGRVPLNLTKYNCKCWITDKIVASAFLCGSKNIFSPVIPKLYQCDAKNLFLYFHVLSFNDLSLLISSAERIIFHNVVVKYADSSYVPLEDIVSIAVNAKYVSVTKPTITSKTMKELPNFTKLRILDLSNLSEVFDIDAFYSYMKKNQHTMFLINFDPQISEAFKNRLETIVDEILETKAFDYQPPVIKFPGLDFQKYRKLCQIFNSH
uniref:Uncharacterized protein n=1 Tax=Panagrolaimus davidi TaxID=227884 RepID=A0A914R6G5_9BILA